MRVFCLVLSTLALSLPVQAEIIASTPDHFTLKHQATSELSPDALWNRLIHPAQWWHHSYSGDPGHMTLELTAGGLWLENWEGGSVAHGEVLYVSPGKQLRLDAPFGPMQSMAVSAIWTITVEPHEDGSKVTFDEVVNGTSASELDKMAPAVDYVKSEALMRLVQTDPPVSAKIEAE